MLGRFNRMTAWRQKGARDLLRRALLGGEYWGRFNRMNPNPLLSEHYDQNGNPIITWRNFANLILNVPPERKPGSSAADVTRGGEYDV